MKIMDKRYVGMIFLGLIILGLSGVAGGCQTYTITMPATDIALSLTDFPSGWQLVKSNDSDNFCNRKFSNAELNIEFSVSVYKSTSDARKQFDLSYIEHANRFSIINLSVGNQAYAFETTSILNSTTMYSVFFRKDNVTVDLDETAILYGITVDDAVSWARAIEEKIS